MIGTRSRKTRGAAMVELALLCPWIVFLFVGLFDWGFYAYSLITLETAARSAVSWNANHNQPANLTDPCEIVTLEMQSLVNMRGVTTCGGSSPVSVAASQVTGPDGDPAAQVSVTYTTPSLIPIPGLLTKQITLTRVVTMRL
jgi:Flp pilus assembly protein TadG